MMRLTDAVDWIWNICDPRSAAYSESVSHHPHGFDSVAAAKLFVQGVFGSAALISPQRSFWGGSKLYIVVAFWDVARWPGFSSV